MIDFACKEFSLHEIVKCSLGLSKADMKVFEYLINHQEKVRTDELEEALGLTLSTVQRAMKKLYEKNILERRQLNLDTGGYVYSYQVKPKKEVAQIIMSIIKNWTAKVEDELMKW